MPPGIVKDPPRSPGVILRADVKSNVRNSKHDQEPATIIVLDKPEIELDVDQPVIFDIERRKIQVDGHEHLISVDVAVNIRVSPQCKNGICATDDDWEKEWKYNVDHKIKSFFNHKHLA